MGQHSSEEMSAEDAQKYPKLDAVSQLEEHINEMLGHPNRQVYAAEIKDMEADLFG